MPQYETRIDDELAEPLSKFASRIEGKGEEGREREREREERETEGGRISLGRSRRGMTREGCSARTPARGGGREKILSYVSGRII